MRDLVCPYCDCDISIMAIEAEDGCCPECGATVGASALFADEDDKKNGDIFEDTDSTKLYNDDYEDDNEDDNEFEDY